MNQVEEIRSEDAPSNAVAVIGLACRFPGVSDRQRFWELLRDGLDAVGGTVRTSSASSDVADAEEGHGAFDAEFFAVSPREARAMDPHQRMMLELGWQALEDARVAPTALRGTPTSVHVGVTTDDYAFLSRKHGMAGISHHTLTGTNRSIIANRFSHFLGLTGPSVVVDTGQSSSLVAVHLACESLRNGDAELAVAAGVQANLAEESDAAAAALGALSPDGKCFTFDARANGYARGEGGVVVVLKPLRLAVADGDHIYGVIVGSAVNNDGAGESLTTPDARGQERVIREACRRADVEPCSVQYVELHGTGTRVGDPVEAAALGATYGLGRSGPPLWVGSAKTNVGHLEGAAGIVGFLKTVLAIDHRLIPPSLNFEQPNPEIRFDEWNLAVARSAVPWRPGRDGRLIGAVSAFGMGGTNCHMVLTSSPIARVPAERQDDVPVPWQLSAHSPAALRRQALLLADHIQRRPDLSSRDIGYSLTTTRAQFPHRAILVAERRDEYLIQLRALAQEESAPGLVTGIFPRQEATTGDRVVFVFPGQGTQWPGMATELLRTSPVFANRMAECEKALSPYVDWRLLDVARALPGTPSQERTDVIQPLLWAVMISLAALWESHGVRPAAVVGHSQGEVAAACVAGALSLADGARIVASRGRILEEELSGSGGMAQVSLPVAVVREELAGWEGRLSVAVINGPSSVVVSGESDALTEMAQRWADRTEVKRIPVSYPSHSVLVEQVKERVKERLTTICPRTSPIAFYSTVTGEPIDTVNLDRDYWFDNLRSTVDFQAAVSRLLHDGFRTFVEVSPHAVLVGSIREIASGLGHTSTAVGSLRRGEGDTRRFMTSMAELHVSGVNIDWISSYGNGARVELPGYGFTPQSYWYDEVQPSSTPTDQNSARRLPKNSAVASARGVAEPFVPVASRDSDTNGVLAVMRKETAAVLGIRDASTAQLNTPFKELGFDSLMLVELVERLRRASGTSLTTSTVFDHPTPRRLADFMEQQRRESQVASPREAPEAEAPRAAAPPDKTAHRASSVTTSPGESADDAVAIVGIGCRYPGDVASPDDLWRLVEQRQDAVSQAPDDRGWRVGSPEAGWRGGFVGDADKFDAAFFGISPREAAAMDPQQRLVLETSWEAVERSGINPETLRGTDTGVFLGAMAANTIDAASEDAVGYRLTGNALSVLSGRVSYLLGLEGPAVTVDTACSSSLVAIHWAVQALRSGECSLALAGGVTVLETPDIFVEFAKQGGLSDDGRCKAYAEAADGTGWSEGAGVLVLERLSRAREQGHPVLALIRGSAINSDGASNGLTAPSGKSQQRVIRMALDRAGLAASEVDVVEGHGTGTVLGDPIEVQALLASYGQGRDAEHPLWLGSLKSNIGHTQAAAGVAGVIKMVMAMRHGTMPATLHVDRPSSKVDWSAGEVRLLTEARAWTKTGHSRRAGVSSFGISGTNAHVILEEAPVEPNRPPSGLADLASAAGTPSGGAPVVVVVSGKSVPALRRQAERLADWMESGPGAEVDLADIGLSTVSTRSMFEHRAALVVGDRAELVGGLRSLASGEPDHRVRHGKVSEGAEEVVFVYPGHGPQWLGMGRELLESSVFAEAMAECQSALDPFVDWSLIDVVRSADETMMARVDVVRPVLWAVMVSLTALWRSFGVTPTAVVGHGQGEIAAACVSGALSLEDGARVVALSARALSALSGAGGMASVALPAEELEARLAAFGGTISVAVVNSAESVVVSGESRDLDRLLAQLADEGTITRKVDVDYAPHSVQVAQLHDDLLATLAPVSPQATTIPWYSTVDGDWMDGRRANAEYWYRNMRLPVRFEAAVRSLIDQDHLRFVEISPHPVLVSAMEETLERVGVPGTVGHTLRGENGDSRQMITAVAQQFVNGLGVDLTAVFSDRGARCVALPTYGFKRTRFWRKVAEPSPDAPKAPGGDSPGRPVEHGSPPWVFPLSATSPQALRVYAKRLADHLDAHRDASLGDVGYSLATTRTGFATRSTVVAMSRKDLSHALRSLADGLPAAGLVTGAVRTGGAAFLFAGQGAHRAGMGVELYGRFPAFADTLDEISSELDAHSLPRSVREVMFSAVPETTALLDTTAFAQPALFTFEVAMSRLLRSWGVEPEALLGHSVGELAAAYEAGVFTLRDAVTLVCARGRLMDSLPEGGAMAALQAGEDEVLDQLRRTGSSAVVAAVNGPSAVVVSGDVDDVLAAVTYWKSLGRRAKRLPVSHAFHSPLLDPVLAELGEVAKSLTYRFPRIPVISGVTGRPVTAEELCSPDYWVTQARQPVRFLDGVRSLTELAPSVLIDVGPNGSAAAMAGECLGARADGVEDAVRVVPASRASRREAVTALEALAAVQVRGAEVDWDAVFELEKPNHVDLPAYPIQREQYGYEKASAGVAAGVPVVDDPAVSVSGQPRPDQEHRSVTHGNGLENLISAHLAAVTGHSDATELDPTATFAQLGLTSVGVIELSQRLQSATGVPLPSTFAFDYPTPDSLQAYLEKQMDADTAAERPTWNPAGEDEAGGIPEDAVVVVGMACRYPGGVRTPEDLWALVSEGKDAISDFPDDRGWVTEELFPPDDPGPHRARGGFLSNVMDFDPSFFGISEAEALTMDPQQRLLLETAWEALERASIDPSSIRGSACGVFVGIALQDYRPDTAAMSGPSASYRMTGTAPSLAAGRIAYFLGTHGPAMTVDTACSSSIVALHLACQSLRGGESSLALAGGATVLATPEIFGDFSRQGGLAGDGRCKAFSADADGTGWAEGVGMLLLERAADARRLGHPVLAVVRSTAINQDGASNGLTAPSGLAQQEVIRQALALARLSAADIDLVEAHGTGTMLGDPVEAGALLATYGADRLPDAPVWLGSLKSNIGHTLAAAGVGGVIKVIMAMRHGIMPKTLHADVPTPHVPWDSAAVKLLHEARPWTTGTRPRRAAVSSFGMSGTNAHTIVEQPPTSPEIGGSTGETAAEPHLVVWPVSGHTHDALRAQAAQLVEYADLHPETNAADIGRSLAARASLRFRAVAQGRTRAEVLDGLRSLADGHPTDAVVEGVASRRAVLFVLPDFVTPDGDGRDAAHAVDGGAELVAAWRGYGVSPATVFRGWSTDLGKALLAGDSLVVHSATDSVLLETIRQTVRDRGKRVAIVECPWPADPSDMAFVAALAQAYVAGAPLNWRAVLAGSGRRVDLPTYAFQRKRYWAFSPQPADTRAMPSAQAAPEMPETIPVPSSSVVGSPPLSVLPRSSQSNEYDAMADRIAGYVADVLHIAAEHVDRESGFFQQGFDSLAAVRLRQSLESDLGLTLPTTLMFEQPTVTALARHLVDEYTAAPADLDAEEPTETTARTLDDPIDSPPVVDLSDDELLALLASEIDQASTVRKARSTNV